MDPLVPSKEAEEPTTVTRDEIILQRRARMLEFSNEIDNVSEACRIIGVSRTSFYKWRATAEHYGLDALMPKSRRRPQLPNEEHYAGRTGQVHGPTVPSLLMVAADGHGESGLDAQTHH